MNANWLNFETMKPRLLLLLVLLLIGADFQQPDLSLEEMSPLDGSWDLVSTQVIGPGMLVLPDQRWVFSGKQWSCSYSGAGFPGRGTLKLGVAGTVQTIDIVATTHGNLFGIWAIRKDQLFILYVLNSKDRPASFVHNGVLLTFKRASLP